MQFNSKKCSCMFWLFLNTSLYKRKSIGLKNYYCLTRKKALRMRLKDNNHKFCQKQLAQKIKIF